MGQAGNGDPYRLGEVGTAGKHIKTCKFTLYTKDGGHRHGVCPYNFGSCHFIFESFSTSSNL